LADPSEVTWQNRIQSAFPNSFETILKENMKGQVRRLSVFDSLVDAGHAVSCLVVDNLTRDNSEIQPSHFMNVRLREQVPWQKDLFILAYDSDRIVLFNSTTASVSDELPLTSDLILFNIKGNKYSLTMYS
jgi:hypothetical protein